MPTPPVRRRRYTRWERIVAICVAVFAFYLGIFLVVFPWLRSWDFAWVPMHSPRLAAYWMSRYFRGALSGLGLLNIYIAITEFGRQLRSAFADDSKS